MWNQKVLHTFYSLSVNTFLWLSKDMIKLDKNKQMLLLHTRVFQPHSTCKFFAGCWIWCKPPGVEHYVWRFSLLFNCRLSANSSSRNSPSFFFLPSRPDEAVTGPDTQVETDPSCQDLPRVGPLGQDHQLGANNSEFLKRQRKESKPDPVVSRKLLSAPNHSHFIGSLDR